MASSADSDPPAPQAPPTPTPPAPAPPNQSEPPKRKRPRKQKGERQNNKGWADGVREEILRPHLAKYTEELAKGHQFAYEYGVKICHEFNYKIPYDLDPKDEPDSPLPDYDPQNPPPLPTLSPEQEKARSEVLKKRNKQVMDWLYYRARKVNPAKPKSDMDDTYALYMMRLTGQTGAPKKARQGWQQYQHENPAMCQASAQRAWEKSHKDGSTLDLQAFEGGDSDEEGVSDGEGDDAGEGTKPTKKTVNFILKHVRQLFNALPESERTALKERAKAWKDAEKARWDEKLKAEPSQAPADVHDARTRLKSFLEPLLNGIHKRTAGAHITVLVGGRNPEEGGRVTVQHYSIGKNWQNTHFAGWNRRRFKKDVVGFFSEYLETVWDEEECNSMALDGTLDDDDDDIFAQAPHRFDEDLSGERGGTDDDVEGEEDERPKKRPRPMASTSSGTATQNEDQEPAEGGENMLASGASGADLPTSPSRGSSAPLPPVRASARLAGIGAGISAGNDDAHDVPSATQAPTADAITPIPPQTTQTLGADLRGIPIDPQLLLPPYTQSPPDPGHVAPVTAATPSSGPEGGSLSRTTGRTGAAAIKPPAIASRRSTRRSSVAAPPILLQGPASALPGLPADAPEWFANALKLLSVPLGDDWASLLHAWARYEKARAYGSNQSQKASRLDAAGCRPKEIADWIGKGRWRTVGCEPAKKRGRFASALLKAWWAWYVKLSPEWREENETGQLDDITAFGEGNGKLDVAGVNGVFSLLAGLKWVGEAVVAEADVDDRSSVERSWRRALRDLAQMLDRMAGI